MEVCDICGSQMSSCEYHPCKYSIDMVEGGIHCIHMCMDLHGAHV